MTTLPAAGERDKNLAPGETPPDDADGGRPYEAAPSDDANDLDAAASEFAKNEGMDRALANAGSWRDLAMEEFRHWLAARLAAGQVTMTFEEFRHDAQNQPPRHQSWGAFANLAAREGLVEFEKYVNAKSRKTHSHPVKLWRINPSIAP